MICNICKSSKVIEGTLEGISFIPTRENKKWFKSGVYGFKANVCQKCGCLSNISIDVRILQKIIREKKWDI